ncbi:MAG TPA: response regulator transcription factor [Candidatus Thiothrix moscowensis]|uniref:response regulator transcription factor n=1 Tax=Thiothrix sp. UBA2016 TaxID=1947695 RepID=UPI0025D69231|nr:response regulator transcription factor [Thiothrix sp. UBA2016]HRJ53129.1 response regulator transcription factor [Candidatus Thiothrix moscowensis]HRJ93120.1 response regulator transcription factor [Candidatus Thiothrix moscowensis]
MFNVMVVQNMPEMCAWSENLLCRAFTEIGIISCRSCAEAEARCGEQPIALALVGLNLPDGNGLNLIAYIRHHSPDTRIVVLTAFDDPEHIFPAIHMGAMGYLLKDLAEEVLIAKLRGAMAGDPPLSPSVARKILEQVRHPGVNHDAGLPQVSLNKREEEILVLVAKGMNRTEIAAILLLSPHTVARYIKDVYKKLDVGTRAEAAIMACRLGLVRM